MAAVTEFTFNVADVAPAMFVHGPAHPAVDTCHWYVTPLPAAVTAKDALAPAHNVVLAGCALIAIGVFTVKVTLFDTMLVPVQLNTSTWYWLPFMAAVAAPRFSVAPVAPAIFVNGPPPVLTCHW